MTTTTLHGVNFGGWLLLEKWITPSLFQGSDAVDEYSLMQTAGAKDRIEKHRQSFITESDFKWLRDNGVTAVRIPVGYWVLEGDPPYISAQPSLDWAMKMAKKYYLQVIVDLHGLKGSQNGRDHSGRVGKSLWFRQSEYRRETVTVLRRIAERYKDYDNFWGLELVNEPRLGLFQLKLRRFYQTAYRELAQILRAHTRIIFSDAFTPRLLSGCLPTSGHSIVIDIHLYHMTTPLASFRSLEWFLKKTAERTKMLTRISRQQPVIIGEWSGVFRHQTVQNVASSERAALSRRYIQAQLKAFESVAGWFYWTYKTEAAGEWSFISQLESGRIVLPDQLANRTRKHPAIDARDSSVVRRPAPLEP